MSTKPIDEFLQDCTVWLEKIAAAKQREEAAYAAINNAQLEKKAFRALARGAGRVALASGRGLSRLGTKMLRAGAKPKPITLQNPLAKQVSAALKSGKPQPKLIRNADGSVAIGSPFKAPAPKTPKPAAKPAKPTQPGNPATPATPEAPVPPPQAKPPAATKGPAAETPQPTSKPADATTKVESPNGQAAQGTQAGTSAQPGAGTEAAAGAAQPGRLGKIMPYALIGGAGFLAGRSTAPDPVYTSPAMVHNNMMYQQSQQAATPNIY